MLDRVADGTGDHDDARQCVGDPTPLAPNAAALRFGCSRPESTHRWQGSLDSRCLDHWPLRSIRTDFLTVAKDFGLVGDGNIPDTNAAFQTPLGDPIPTDGDYSVYLPTTGSPYSASPPAEFDLNSDLVGIHSLVASGDPGNRVVLRSIEQALEGR